jgi:hypothetical protein
MRLSRKKLYEPKETHDFQSELTQVKQLTSEDTLRVSVASFIESHINRFNQSIVSLFHWNLNMQVRLCIFKC